MVIDILLLIFFVGMFLTFLRGNYHRQLTKARANAAPIDADERVHAELWKVRTRFEGLFKDSRARENALSLFPELRNLTPSPTKITPELPSYWNIAATSLLWPVALPVSMTGKAAANLVSSEQKDAAAQREQYELLAEFEPDPDIAAAYRLGDPAEVHKELFRIMRRSNEQAKELEAKHDDLLDTSTPLTKIKDMNYA